jgi:hypothetical protein
MMQQSFRFASRVGWALPTWVACLYLGLPTAEAATFAYSEAGVNLSNFSANPSSTLTDTDTDAFTFALVGEAEAEADAIALFEQTSASNNTFGLAAGDGTLYSSTASSFAQVVGTFSVGPKTPFSFDFASFLALEATVDLPGTEVAKATGQITFQLFDDATGALLDQFGVSGSAVGGKGGPSFHTMSNPFVQASFTQGPDPEGSASAAIAEFVGTYARLFDGVKTIRLEETKSNQTQAELCLW